MIYKLTDKEVAIIAKAVGQSLSKHLEEEGQSHLASSSAQLVEALVESHIKAGAAARLKASDKGDGLDQKWIENYMKEKKCCFLEARRAFILMKPKVRIESDEQRQVPT